jgi:hypothetical protein
LDRASKPATSTLRILHRGAVVVEHPELPGKHQLRILPEHGPGASARTARQRHSTAPDLRTVAPPPAVEIRNLAVYDALLGNAEIGAPLTDLALSASGELDLTLVEVSA